MHGHGQMALGLAFRRPLALFLDIPGQRGRVAAGFILRPPEHFLAGIPLAQSRDALQGAALLIEHLGCFLPGSLRGLLPFGEFFGASSEILLVLVQLFGAPVHRALTLLGTALLMFEILTTALRLFLRIFAHAERLFLAGQDSRGTSGFAIASSIRDDLLSLRAGGVDDAGRRAALLGDVDQDTDDGNG